MRPSNLPFGSLTHQMCQSNLPFAPLAVNVGARETTRCWHKCWRQSRPAAAHVQGTRGAYTADVCFTKVRGRAGRLARQLLGTPSFDTLTLRHTRASRHTRCIYAEPLPLRAADARFPLAPLSVSRLRAHRKGKGKRCLSACSSHKPTPNCAGGMGAVGRARLETRAAVWGCVCADTPPPKERQTRAETPPPPTHKTPHKTTAHIRRRRSHTTHPHFLCPHTNKGREATNERGREARARAPFPPAGWQLLDPPVVSVSVSLSMIFQASRFSASGRRVPLEPRRSEACRSCQPMHVLSFGEGRSRVFWFPVRVRQPAFGKCEPASWWSLV